MSSINKNISIFVLLTAFICLSQAIKLQATETSCDAQKCVSDTSGYMYDEIQDEQDTLNSQYEQQADAMLAQDIAEAAWVEASEAQLASQQALEIQIAQQEASESQLLAVQAQEDVYEQMSEIADAALQESIQLQNEAFELQREALDEQQEVAMLAYEGTEVVVVTNETDCNCTCSTTETDPSSTTLKVYKSEDEVVNTCGCDSDGNVAVVDNTNSTNVFVDGDSISESIDNSTESLSAQLDETNQALDDLAETTADLVSDSLNDNIHVFAMPQPLTTFLDSYEKMCDDLATLEDVTLISQCNEYDYYADKIEENYMMAITGDITLSDFEESTSATIDPVYNQYEQYFADLEGRATISTCELAEDQMYSAIEAANDLGVSSTEF